MKCDHREVGQCYVGESLENGTLEVRQADPHIRITDELVRIATAAPTERMSASDGVFHVGGSRGVAYALSAHCDACKTWTGKLVGGAS